MEAGASSLIGPIISQVHYNYTREKVFWNYEISRIMAIDPEYNLPKGFSSVYYVDPRALLKRDYDKIIILQRDKKALLDDICDRYKLKFNPEHVEFYEKLDFYYDLIYNQEIEDPRLFRVRLEDLTNYPVATYSDLFDFLGYPKKGRPLIIPLPIDPNERDWKKRSSILRKGHKEGKIEKDDYTQ